MNDFTAIILAAGRGLRMGPRGNLHPKGLLRLGDRTLIEHSVAALHAHGVRRIRIVTGHLSGQYESLFRGAGPGVELVFNDLAAQRGSLHSLSVGLRGVIGPCVILESDLIYQPRALSGLIGGRSRLIISGPTEAGDEVYTWTDPMPGAVRRLRDLSKDRSKHADPPLGELVGITGISPRATGLMTEIATKICADNPGADYEQGLVALSAIDPIHCHLIADLIWAEIDDEKMYEHAKREVFPQMAALNHPVR